ncbi:RagB/SusD family nutrient uptake outer membrane protein [Chitinophaga lutea]
MKRHTFSKISLLMAAMIATAIPSCKSYLDLNDPDNLFSEQYVYSNVSGAKGATIGVYAMLSRVFNGGTLPTRFSLDTDEGWGTTGSGDNGQADISRYNINPTNNQLTLAFENLYLGIERANNVIKNIPQMALYANGNAQEKAELRRFHGEALTLRAIFYLELIKNWGDVPAPFEPSLDQKDLALPKTNRDEIYDHILEDLKTATELVPWKGEGSAAVIDERITKATVKAVRAKVALYAGGYSLRISRQMERRADYLELYKIVQQECTDIMARGDIHKLNPAFKSIFQDNILAYKIEPNGEVLLETGVGRTAVEGSTGYIDGPRYIPVGLTALAGSGGSFHVMPSYLYAFDKNDQRRSVMFAPYNTNLNTMIRTPITMPSWVLGKFRLDWLNPLPNSTAQQWGVNTPLIRLSDVMLMLAEVENELNGGPTPAAIAAFEAVRKRAFKGNEDKIGVTPADKDGFFKAIMNERWFEFTGEGVRKYDLIRWNLLGTRIAEAKATLSKMLAKTPPYDNLPQTMWYKLNSPGDIVWGNSMDERTPATPMPAGYAAVAWMSALTQKYIDNVAQGFQAGKNELLPIPLTSLNSNPNLKQDYGY